MIHFKFKVLILGPPAVGKTSLLNRFVNDEFKFDYHTTIGAKFLTKEIDISSKKKKKSVQLSLWDVGGQPKFVDLRTTFYRGSHGALLVFDLIREETFKELETWYSEMIKVLNEDTPIIIIGNKSDLIPTEGRQVDLEEVKKFIEEKNSFYIETSAKTGMNVNKAFTELTRLIAERQGSGFTLKKKRREAFFVRNRVQDYFKSQGYEVSDLVIEGNVLNEIIARILDKAINNAKKAGRKTVQPEDI